MLNGIRKIDISIPQLLTIIIGIGCYLIYNIPREWDFEKAIISTFISLICLIMFHVALGWEKDHPLGGIFLLIISFPIWGATILVPVILYLSQGIIK